ncbi:MAG: transposase [Deltaproteobacteria bacterium HGW-Deltaproteobacteria-1]|jgi:hypothetical protein|nr:MAG: transposase [Deltaproteobacteria bacterium HGW-Deltaproteobacteria-1]
MRQYQAVEETGMSINKKIRHIENTIVLSPSFKQAIAMIRECHERSKLTTEPKCMLLIGNTGYGKTTIANHYVGQYARVVSKDGTTVPVFYSMIPSNATIKGLACRLLEDLGDPLYDRGTTINMTSRLCRLIKECKVELIILDEFQHLIDRDSDRVLRSTADWLKDVLNRTKVPIVLMGMPNANSILTVNPQLMRRFANICELKAFNWNPVKERDDFLRFLIMIEKATFFPQPSILHSNEIALRIFCATKGVVSYIKKLISKAAEIAYVKNLDRVTTEALALAYNDELALSNTMSNPFLVDHENLNIPSLEQSFHNSSDAARHGGKRRVAEILRR